MYRRVRPRRLPYKRPLRKRTPTPEPSSSSTSQSDSSALRSPRSPVLPQAGVSTPPIIATPPPDPLGSSFSSTVTTPEQGSFGDLRERTFSPPMESVCTDDELLALEFSGPAADSPLMQCQSPVPSISPTPSLEICDPMPDVKTDMVPRPILWGPMDPDEFLTDRLYDPMRPYIEAFRKDKTYISIEMKWEANLMKCEGDIFVGHVQNHSVELIHQELTSADESLDCVIIEDIPGHNQEANNMNVSVMQQNFKDENQVKHITLVKKFIREKHIGLTEVYRVFIETGTCEFAEYDGTFEILQEEITAAIKIHAPPDEPNIRAQMRPFIHWLYTMERRYCFLTSLLECEFGVHLCANGDIIQAGNYKSLKQCIERLFG